MSCRACAALVLLLASAHADELPVPPELHGILVTGQNARFALVASGGAPASWAKVGDSFAGWKVCRYLPREEAVVLSRRGTDVTVRLPTAKVHDGGGETPSAPTPEEADEVLQGMQFDAMWESVVREQRKGILAGMRQQAVPEFKKAGLNDAEIDSLLDRMGDAVMAGLDPELMRQDFARVFSEVYSKQELQGMAAFYQTAAGRAWAAKQPEVQQKIMQAMMPRVMAGMPAAQKLAVEYLQQRGRSSTAPNR